MDPAWRDSDWRILAFFKSYETFEIEVAGMSDNIWAEPKFFRKVNIITAQRTGDIIFPGPLVQNIKFLRQETICRNRYDPRRLGTKFFLDEIMYWNVTAVGRPLNIFKIISKSTLGQFMEENFGSTTATERFRNIKIFAIS